MKVLLTKEIKYIFCSSSGFLFVVVSLFLTGSILWLFPGRYNIIESGYANLSSFFNLSPLLFAVMISALTMNTFTDEAKSKTLGILIARPISLFHIYMSKYLAVLLFVTMVLLSTTVYVYSIYVLAHPVGHIDLWDIALSYLSLFLVLSVLVAIGVFASSLNSNHISAFVFSVSISFFVLFGFDFLASFSDSGKINNYIASLGLSYHYQMMQRGVLELKNILTILFYLVLFTSLTLFVLKKWDTKRCLIYIASISILFLVVVYSSLFSIRFDFTSDNRYSMSSYTKALLNKIKGEDIQVMVYLDGDLNYEFQHLQDAVKYTLDDMNGYTDNSMLITYKNPRKMYASLEDMYKEMNQRDMQGIILNEVDREGKTSQKVIYPYAELIANGESIIIPLLKNVTGYTATENIKLSIENLEFEFVDAIRLLKQEKTKNIAFIEGHGEPDSDILHDAEEILSKYYNINRGEVGVDVAPLLAMDAIVIVGSKEKYTETEKYILDQYIMQGGKVLWVLDGVVYSHESLMKTGTSATVKNEINLDDLLFTYGVRINSDLIQDAQCVSTYFLTGSGAESSTLLPCLYMPLFMPSIDNVVTKSVQNILGAYTSSIDLVNANTDINKQVLLTTSANTRLNKVPEAVNFELPNIDNQRDYFNQSFIAVAVSMDGKFPSAFADRSIPEGVSTDAKRKRKSEKTRMIIVSGSQIITNTTEHRNNQIYNLPMGYDKAARKTHGNRSFVTNALNWLTDDEGWMELRAKEQIVYVLDRKQAYEKRDFYAVVNILVPILLCIIVIALLFLYRKKKYEV